jgi:hypothetical protein
LADVGAQISLHQPGPRRRLRPAGDRRHRRTGLSFAEVKALATGDPRIMEKPASTRTSPGSAGSNGPGTTTSGADASCSTTPATKPKSQPNAPTGSPTSPHGSPTPAATASP